MVLGQNVVTQGSLDVEEGGKRQAGEATVLLVLDLAFDGVAKSGAQDADRTFAVALDFKMDGVLSFDGSKSKQLINDCRQNYFKCMATL